MSIPILEAIAALTRFPIGATILPCEGEIIIEMDGEGIGILHEDGTVEDLRSVYGK